MPTILNNEMVAKILTMDLCIQAIEEAYLAWGDGQAISRPRSDIYFPTSYPNTFYVLKTMDGALTPYKVAAVRINSDLITWREIGGKTRKYGGGLYNAFMLLFSADSGELLGIITDGYIQKMRVGATNGVSVKYLAKRDSKVLAMIGTGRQASAAIEAVTNVRKLDLIKVYSPNQDHRIDFAKRMSNRLKLDVLAVGSAREAVEGSDIVGACTNSLHRVIESEWLEPGQHIFCVKYVELGDGVREKANTVFVNSKKATAENYVPGHGRIDAHDPIDLVGVSAGKEGVDQSEEEWAKDTPELWEVISGRHPGRTKETDITLFVNNIGLGLQFAAVGAKVLELARAQGLGIDVPIDWFVNKEEKANFDELITQIHSSEGGERC
jgi:ornithine cyclodeaminase/alanine dehydrogenase-like protein (mu-crystallin family)